ncbi:MAG: mechanosensitive ion channel family protein, partial [Akkermansiaceae bacterium]
MNRFLSSLIKPRIFLGLLLLVVVSSALVYLAAVGKLEPWIAYLRSDAMSIELGGDRISAYRALKSIFIIIASLWIAGVVSHFVNRKISGISKMRSGNKALVSKMLQVVIYVVVFMVATHALGINVAALAVLGGTIGIGIGFGLQKITSNFISGMILLFEKSIEAGDLIELQGGVLGYVRQTHARYTLIETLDGKEVMVPNEDFIINHVTNL